MFATLRFLFLLVCSKKESLLPDSYIDSSVCKHTQVFLCEVTSHQMDPSLLCCKELLQMVLN